MKIYYINKEKSRNYRCRDKDETIKMFNEGHFTLVADALYDDSALEDVYKAMQNLDKPWDTNPDVLSYAPSIEYTRSMSVGDVVCKGDGINKKYFKVASCGFERLHGID